MEATAELRNDAGASAFVLSGTPPCSLQMSLQAMCACTTSGEKQGFRQPTPAGGGPRPICALAVLPKS